MKNPPRFVLAVAALACLCGCTHNDSALRTPDGRRLTPDYLRGRSDGAKKFYWNLQDQQRSKAPAESYRLYEVTIPEHWENGVLVERSQRVLRIQE
jgi:hypothetical protein